MATFDVYRSRKHIEAKERPDRHEFVTRDGQTISSETFNREWEKIEQPAPAASPVLIDELSG